MSGAKFYALVGDLRDTFMPVQVEVLEEVEKENVPWIDELILNEGVTVYDSGSSESVEN